MNRRWSAPTRVTWWAIGSAAVMTLATAAYLAAIYPSLPYGVPVRYVAGRPFIYQIKSPLVVMLPSIVQLGLLVIFGALILLLLWRAETAASDGRVPSDGDNTRMSLAAEGIALLAAIWIAVQTLGAVRLIILWRGAWGGFGRVYALAVTVAIFVSIVVMTRTMKLVRRQPRTAIPDDPALWRMRQLYFNPRDPALFVPTRTGVGFTLNFGRPLAILVLVVMLVVGIWGPYTLAKFVLRGFSLEN